MFRSLLITFTFIFLSFSAFYLLADPNRVNLSSETIGLGSVTFLKCSNGVITSDGASFFAAISLWASMVGLLVWKEAGVMSAAGSTDALLSIYESTNDLRFLTFSFSESTTGGSIGCADRSAAAAETASDESVGVSIVSGSGSAAISSASNYSIESLSVARDAIESSFADTWELSLSAI